MTYEEWAEKYRPIQNPFDPSASYEGRMFETYGDEVDMVKATPDPRCIWTLLDEDDHTWIGSGWHFVNRLGYFITEVPFEGDTLEIDLDDPGDEDSQLRFFEIVTARDGESFEDWVEARDPEEARAKARDLIAGVYTSIGFHPQDEADDFEGELDFLHVSEPEFPDGSFIHHPGTGTLIAASECQIISAEVAAEIG